MNHYLATALLVMLLANQLALVPHEQTQDWHVYSSSEDQFTVAVPRAVQITKTAERKNEASLGRAEKGNLESYVSVYEDKTGFDETSKFRILVTNGKAKLFDSLSRADLLSYLSVMMIGDDDDPRPSTERAIKVNGLNGKEYVWSTERKVLEYGSTNELFSRGRIFDTGDRIYIIVFKGENANELKSQVAERFLNSFRLNR